MRFRQIRMSKRKFDFSIDVSANVEEPKSDESLAEVPARLERDVAASKPTGEGPVEGVSCDHIDTYIADVDEGDELGVNAF